MRRFEAGTILLLLFALSGCAENSLVLKGQVDKAKQDQVALNRQREELQSRATALDRDNQEHATLLAQSRQQSKMLEEQLVVLRDQLSSTTSQLMRLREERKVADQKIQAMTASLQRQGGSVSIAPNNSLAQTLPAINLPDVFVRRDGDVVRIELPSHRLFEPGNAKLQPAAPQIIAAATNEALRVYPDQVLGIEGHTDPDPVANAQWRNNHQLAIGRALAVYDVITTQNRVSPGQVFVAGHGGNRPIFSNATPAGKQRNNRVELVIYPETVRRQ